MTLIDSAAIALLHRLAEDAVESASASRSPADDYARLRCQAGELNRRYGLMSDDEFNNLLPSPSALLEIDALHQAFGATFDDPPSRAPAATPDTLRALLRSIAGWATGLDAANQTLR